jgi:hypothetical protein
MDLSGLRLRRLPVSLRIGVACFAASIAIGEAASLVHLVNHHAGKDETPGLSLADLEGAYHGVDQPSRLARSIDSDHVRQHAPDEKERAALGAWLSGSRVNQDYDDEDRFGELAPALVLERRCTSCHSRNPTDVAGAKGIASTLPLDSWGDVSKVAFERKLDKVPTDILAMSTHAHALTMPLVALACGLLCLATSWPRKLVRGLVALGAIGLFVDLAAWWLARPDFLAGALPFGRLFFVKAIVAGGTAFAAALALQLLLILADVCLPARREPPVG